MLDATFFFFWHAWGNALFAPFAQRAWNVDENDFAVWGFFQAASLWNNPANVKWRRISCVAFEVGEVEQAIWRPCCGFFDCRNEIGAASSLIREGAQALGISVRPKVFDVMHSSIAYDQADDGSRAFDDACELGGEELEFFVPD
jgi:hypothetical protein